MNTSCVSPSRCLAVWLVSCGLLAGLVGWVAPLLLAPPEVTRGGFDQILVSSCAAGALLAAGWLWLGVSVVTARAWRGRPHSGFPGLPAGLTRFVLVACGVALTGGLVAPGAASAVPAASTPVALSRDRPLLQGLPLPERALGGKAPRRVAAQRVVDVRPGDTLWGLSQRDLPAGASPAAISVLWHRIYAHNRDVIGPDPDLLQPGQRLELPAADPSSPHD